MGDDPLGGPTWYGEGSMGEIDAPPRRRIVLGADLAASVASAVDALGRAGRVYQRAGRLVDVAHLPGGALVRALTPASLRLRMAEAAEWHRPSEDGDGRRTTTRVQPPADLAGVVLEAGEWAIRDLIGIAPGPLVRPDGSMADAPGYDEATRWYLDQDPSGWVPDDASLCREVADVALDQLRELTEHYPCATNADRSALISGLLTAIGRTAIDGPSPLHLVHATTAGSGKTLWVDVVSRIATGAPAARMPPSDNEDEERKRITSILLGGAPIVLVDNVAGSLGGASLDALLTSRVWTDRILGSSEMVRLPVTCAIFATGNNVTVRGDLARRTIPARLEPREERPEQRDGLPDLEAIATRDRAALLRAALTVILAYMREPERVQCRPIGSYSAWSRIAREPLIWLGMADPLDAQDALRGIADVAADTAASILSAIVGVHGYGSWAARDLGALYRDHEIRIAIEEAGLVRGRDVDARALGYWLRRTRGRNIGGMVLEDAGTGHGNTRRWRIRPAQHGTPSPAVVAPIQYEEGDV